MSFSIVICTFNPDRRTLSRLLARLQQFRTHAKTLVEIILVDNKSVPAISSLDFVDAWLLSHPLNRCIVEHKPGLTAARLCGISEAKMPWLIFFDDDNEPAIDYVDQVAAFTEDPRSSRVGAFGPGTINVEYLDDVAPWLQEVKDLFQERTMPSSMFSSERAWQPHYPVGTGMVIRRDIALRYAARVNDGTYTLSDRKGKSLSSGGDVQMVFTAIQQGYQVGALAGLTMRHLIGSDKANLRYLKKQQYGTASAYVKAYNQVYTDAPIPAGRIRNDQVFLRLYSLFRIYYRRLPQPQFALLVCSKMGEFKAVLEAYPQSTPWVLRLIEKWIHGK